MKAIVPALIAAVFLAAIVPAGAKTASGTIPVTAQIVSGNSVTSYLKAGEITTSVRSGSSPEPASGGAPAVLRVDFELQRSWQLVKRVTWDKLRKHLTVDF